MSPLSIALSYIYITTSLHDILLCQSGQGYSYIWQVKGYKNLCHSIKTADEDCEPSGSFPVLNQTCQNLYFLEEFGI